MAEFFWSLNWIVSKNIVANVVKLKIKFEKAPKIDAKLPKKVLNMLVPVNTMFVKSGLEDYELANPL